MRVAFFAFLVLVTPCAAQGRVEVSPFVGYYVPSSSVIGAANSSPGDTKTHVNQNAAATVGARITVSVSPRVALDASFEGSTSVASAVVWGGSGDVHTRSARVLVRLTSPASPAWVGLVGGVAQVQHSGTAYSVLGMDTRSSGVVAGAAARLWLGRALALRAELNDFIYTFKGARSTVTTGGNNPSQHDLSISLGLSLTPLGHTGL